jgi:hypothetical protein
MKNFRVTKGGMVVLAALAVAVVISLVTTGAARFLAAAVIAFTVLLIVGEGVAGGYGPMNAKDPRSGGINAEAARTREVLRRGAKKRRFDP